MKLKHYKQFDELLIEIRDIPYHHLNFIGDGNRKQLAEVIYNSINNSLVYRLKYNLPCTELIMNQHDLDTLQLYFTDCIQDCDNPIYIREISFGYVTLTAYVSKYNEVDLGMFLIR